MTLDRTNWEFGCIKINFLVLAIAYKGIAVPVMWAVLPKKGNSNCEERVILLNRFISCFGKEVIAGVLADREFIGKQWFKYLKKEKIPFFIRIRWNFLVSNTQGRMVNAWQLFTGLRKGEKRILAGTRKIFGSRFNLAGLRCNDGDFLIVATTERAENAIEIYGHRWEIETLFGCLKTRGFNLENTHLTQQDRLSKLMAVLAIAFCWAHKGMNSLRRQLCKTNSTRKEVMLFIRLLFAPPGSFNLARLRAG